MTFYQFVPTCIQYIRKYVILGIKIMESPQPYAIRYTTYSPQEAANLFSEYLLKIR